MNLFLGWFSTTSSTGEKYFKILLINDTLQGSIETCAFTDTKFVPKLAVLSGVQQCRFESNILVQYLIMRAKTTKFSLTVAVRLVKIC